MSGHLSGSFSIHSLVEGSEAISEAEEIQEVKLLQRRGDQAFRGKHFSEALRYYNDALEIDENNSGALASRSAVFIEMGNFILAQTDAEKLLTILPNHAQGHYLLGVALDSLGQYREGLTGYLSALELDTDPGHADILANHIAALAQHFCDMPSNLVDSLADMDPYKKLSEVGACLYQAGRYDQCIKVLNAAQKVATNQRGITMKVQLTLANAHSALKHTDIAISLYQECLSTAMSTHDHMYQTKALVNIASLFLEVGDTHRAIVHYEKLLDLEKEIRGEEKNAPLPAYWTFELQCALHLNLSIAYKAIGSLELAVYFAQLYTQLLQNSDVKPSVQAQSFHNEGLLHDILGDYQQALDNYKCYLTHSKAVGDKRGVAQAYGCLGSVYAALNNYQLSITYHEQHVALAEKLSDARLVGQAYEQFGDSRVNFGEYDEAVECYMSTIKSCARSDLRVQTAALCKIGKAYCAQKRYQYSMYYFEQAKVIAEDFDFVDIKLVCEYNLACILQHSTQMYEIDQAQKYFEHLIPVFEGKIQQHQEEDTFCPKEMVEHLDHCYQGIIHIYAKSGYKDEALVYAEAMHKKQTAKCVSASTVKSPSLGSLTSSGELAMFDVWSVDKIKRVVSEQNATVLYYCLLPQSILIWVLQPAAGVVRFYASKPQSTDTESVSQQLASLGKKLLKSRNLHELVYDCENRALPERDTELKHLQRANQQLSGSMYSSQQLFSEEGSSGLLPTTDSEASQSSNKKEKSAERLLFDILVAPVDDVLCKLEAQSPLIIVPDRSLSTLPFGCIRDWNQTELKHRFRITTLSSLYVLDRVTQNQVNHMQKQDGVDFQRSQSRLGGVQKLLSPQAAGNQGKRSAFNFPSRLHVTETGSSCSSEGVNARRTSNPRLAKSGALVPPAKAPVSVPLTARASRLSQISSKVAAPVPQGKVLSPPATASLTSMMTLGSPTRPERLLSVQSMSTLTTKTSTNTDIVKADYGVAEFVQVSNPEKCLIIGSPQLPESVLLRGETWNPRRELKKCQSECFKVAEILGVHAVVGDQATKDRFIQEIQQASIVHIASYACLEEGQIVMTPNVNRHEKGPPLEHSYLLTAKEIADLTLTAKMIVLSCGWSSQPRDHKPVYTTLLASAFLMAGAQCVVTLLWPVPNATLQKFYFHFYQALQGGSFVSEAILTASKELKNDNRYSDPSYWAPYVLMGADVHVDLQEVRHAMLDQTIDRVEQETGDQLTSPPLNPQPVVPKVPTYEENLDSVQKYLGQLLVQHDRQEDVIPQLILLLDGSLKRQHLEENNRQTACLPACLAATHAALSLLKILGFHFQGRGPALTDPYIIYPHWNPDDLLVPTYDALRAMLDLVSSPACARAIYEFFPGSQEMLAYIIDVLCITKHAPEIQLKVSDMSVRPLWRNIKVKAILVAMGFHQIGPLLNFNNVPSNWKLLNAGLQLFISMSAFKSSTLLHKLDVTLLGGPNSTGKSSITFEQVKLPSLTPALLPRHQLRMSTPWLTTAERPAEMDEKMRVAQSKVDLRDEFRQHMRRAKTWHQVTLSSHANEALVEFGRPQTHNPKVKVKAGATASCERTPVDEKPKLDLLSTEQRRDYANYVYQERLDSVTSRHRDSVRKMYLPYVQNICTH